jgi:hypothetical protein
MTKGGEIRSAAARVFCSLLLAQVLGGCRDIIQDRATYGREPYAVRDCRVYGVEAVFPRLMGANRFPVNFAQALAVELNSRRINATFVEADSAILHFLPPPSEDATPFTIIVVQGDSAMQTSAGLGCICQVKIVNGIGLAPVADYVVLTAIPSRSYARKFVAEILDPAGRLVSGP